MRLVQTLFSGTGFRDPDSNAVRLGLIAELMREAGRTGTEILVLPAGVLTAHTESEVGGRIAEVATLARPSGFIIVGGVDASDSPGKGHQAGKSGVDYDDLVRCGRLTYFGFCVGPTVARPIVWRQISTTNKNANLVDPDLLPGANRLVDILGKRVGILMCGELYSRPARERMAAERPDFILDLGHIGMGQGLIPAMRSLAKLAAAAVGHSQHVAGWWGRQFHFVEASGQQKSAPADETNVITAGDLWVAWHLRNV